MPVWRIFPVAPESTERWLDYGHWSEMLVRAPTAAQARVVASAELNDRSEPIGNESAAGHAGLEDEKLYHVVEVEGADGDGPEAVLEARRDHEHERGTLSPSC